MRSRKTNGQPFDLQVLYFYIEIKTHFEALFEMYRHANRKKMLMHLFFKLNAQKERLKFLFHAEFHRLDFSQFKQSALKELLFSKSNK